MAKDNIFPVFIATKGRHSDGLGLTITGLVDAGIPVTAFVEPQELRQYAVAFPSISIVDIGQNDMGLGFARQAIIEYARHVGATWYWLLDDDIKKPLKVSSSRCVDATYEYVFLTAQEIIREQENIGIAGLGYSQYAWSSKTDFTLYSSCDGFVAINTDLTHSCNYRIDLPMKADRDFTLQVLSSGAISMKINRVTYATQSVGSGKGGLHDAYRSMQQEKTSRLMESLWPDVCTYHIKKNGHPDVKINWRKFRGSA